jgi:TLC domain
MQFPANYLLHLFANSYLSGGTHSLLVEATSWVIIYTIYAHVFSGLLRSVSKHLPWWELAKTRGGVFCGNAQDDSILLVILCLHHGIAGAMMAYGQFHSNPMMWRHGYLLETGFEIADLIAMLLHTYPYRHEGIKPELKMALVFHHLPGISLAAFILEAGLHHNEHMRAIGMWLLLGACASCFAALNSYCLSIKTQMKQLATTSIVNFTFFVYCRFYEFPKHSYYLIRDVQSSDEFEGTIMLKLLFFGAIALALFNLGIVADLLPKNIRYVKRAIDGVTPLETKPVPKSREDRMKRRRTSLMVALDTLDQVRRRSSSSVLTVMHLNVVEDLGRHDNDMEDINEEDMAALNAFVTSLNKKTK